jgi:hypothetical protein
VTKPNWSDMLAGETMLAWLQRTDTDRDWTADEITGRPVAHLGARYTQEFGFFIRPTFSEVYFAAARDRQLGLPTSETVVPPVWPGLDRVTVGTPVALVDGAVVPGPLDGVIVDVTDHPTGAGRYAFGAISSWRYLGAVLFVADNGAAEWPISIGPESGVVTPRSMVRAASATVRLSGAFTGTVTPWLITPGG